MDGEVVALRKISLLFSWLIAYFKETYRKVISWSTLVLYGHEQPIALIIGP